MYSPAEVGQGPERVLSLFLDVVPVGMSGSLFALLGVLRANVFPQGMEAQAEKCDFVSAFFLFSASLWRYLIRPLRYHR